MSIEFYCAEPADSPWNTSYAWDNSHALVTTYHPYCHSPSALTKYLKQKLRLQWAKRLGHSLPAQVEPNVQLKRNIKGSLCKIILISMKSCATYTSTCAGRSLRRLGEERERMKSSSIWCACSMTPSCLLIKMHMWHRSHLSVPHVMDKSMLNLQSARIPDVW